MALEQVAVKPAVAQESYGFWHGVVDLMSLLAFVSAMTILMISLLSNLPHILAAYASAGWILVLVALSAILAADFVSGLVHFLADNFGNPNTPVLGRMFIFPFREHHADPKAITRHSYLETNGANCLISLPFVSFVFLTGSGDGGFFSGLWTWFFLTAIFFTNQIHKWAHTDAPPRLVRKLQKWHLVLSPKNHGIHHMAPHDKYYCITGGWLNPILQKIRFYEGLKKILEGKKQ